MEEAIKHGDVANIESQNKGNKPKLDIEGLYNKNVNKLLWITLIVLFLSIGSIVFKVVTTGDFINKDISLKGGVTITIPVSSEVDIDNLKKGLSADFSKKEIDVRSLKKGSVQSAIIITSDIDGTKASELDSFMAAIEKHMGLNLVKGEYSIEVIGSSLGTSFFKEVIRALILAFIFMGITVIIYFRNLFPSLIVILCAFSDMIETLAVVDLLGIKVSTAGIAAFLMLVGYSVDTDILLTTRVLKRREGKSIFHATIGAMKTGLMMTSTAFIAVVIALVFSQSETIRQIMLILLIGLVFDVFNTWIQNSTLLKIYLEKRAKKNG